MRLSSTQIRKVYNQLADLLIILSKHPFDRIGSLTLDHSGSVQLGPIQGDRTGTLSQIGPFDNSAHYYVSWAREYLRLIADGQLFGRFQVDAYLMFKRFADLAASDKCNPENPDSENRCFYLKHMDDKGDHILVDEYSNITGIIDWSFARIVPAHEAFGPSLVTAKMGHVFDGVPGQSENDRILACALEEKGSDFARYAHSPDFIRRLTFGLGMGMNVTWKEAFNLFNGVLITFGEEPVLIDDWQKWREQAVSKWGNDQSLVEMLRLGNDP